MAGIKRGNQAFLNGGSNDGDGVEFFSINPGETKEIVPLAGLTDPDNALAVWQHEEWNNYNDEGNKAPVVHVCIGEDEDCPGCENGMGGRMRFFLPILEGPDVDNAVRIFAFGPMIKDQIETFYQDLGEDGFIGGVFSLKRVGAKKETRYQLWPNSRAVDVDPFTDDIPAIDERLGPLDRDGILALYEKKGYLQNGNGNGATAEEGGFANLD